jgi:hypothetical protein
MGITFDGLAAHLLMSTNPRAQTSLKSLSRFAKLTTDLLAVDRIDDFNADHGDRLADLVEAVRNSDFDELEDVLYQLTKAAEDTLEEAA